MTEIAMPEKAKGKNADSKGKDPQKGGRPTPWRDNIEAILMAIVMAIVLKYFIVEAYRIPTGSMQPTLMGNSRTGVYDRILVDKFTPVLRNPLGLSLSRVGCCWWPQRLAWFSCIETAFWRLFLSGLSGLWSQSGLCSSARPIWR